MKRLIAAAIILLSLAASALAQVPELKPVKNLKDPLVPAQKKDKWGYATENGKIVIKAVFDEAEPFTMVSSPDGVSMQVARIRVGTGWGYITRENVYLIEPLYDTLSRFDKFNTVVASMGPFKTLMGVRSGMNARADFPIVVSNILEVNLQAIDPFNEDGVAWASRSGKWGILDYRGRWAVPCKYDSRSEEMGMFRVVAGDKVGYVKADGTEVIPVEYDSLDWRPEIEGFLARKDGLRGVLAIDGKSIIPVVYEDLDIDPGVGYFIKKDGKKGLLSGSGIALIPAEYDSVTRESYGYLAIKGNRRLAVGPGPDCHVIFSEGAWMADPAMLLAAGYESVAWNESLGGFLVKQAGLWGLLAPDGTVRLKSTYTTIAPKSFGYYVVLKDGSHAAMGKDGEEIIGPGNWSADPEKLIAGGYESFYWDDRLGFIVLKDNKYGRLAENGIQLYPCQFDELPDPENKGYVELLKDDEPWIFVIRDKEYSVKDYDRQLYRTLGSAAYSASTLLPAWLKNQPDDNFSGGSLIITESLIPKLYYRYNVWAKRTFVELGYDLLNAERSMLVRKWIRVSEGAIIKPGGFKAGPALNEEYECSIVLAKEDTDGMFPYQVIVSNASTGTPAVLGLGYIGLYREYFTEPVAHSAPESN